MATIDFSTDSVGLKKLISLRPSRSEAVRAFLLSLKKNEKISPKAIVRYGIQLKKEGGDTLLFPLDQNFKASNVW